MIWRGIETFVKVYVTAQCAILAVLVVAGLFKMIFHIGRVLTGTI